MAQPKPYHGGCRWVSGGTHMVCTQIEQMLLPAVASEAACLAFLQRLFVGAGGSIAME